jgi:hypothetical protein
MIVVTWFRDLNHKRGLDHWDASVVHVITVTVSGASPHSASAVLHVLFWHAIHICTPNAIRGSDLQPFARENSFGQRYRD